MQDGPSLIILIINLFSAVEPEDQGVFVTTMEPSRPQTETQFSVDVDTRLSCAVACLQNRYNFAVWSPGNKTCDLYDITESNLKLNYNPQVIGMEVSPLYHFEINNGMSVTL